MSASQPAPWQTFRSWVGTRREHPLRELLDLADDGSSDAVAACEAWDDLLSRIERVRPMRWESKRREFRGQSRFSETLSEKSELVLAVTLAEAGVTFEFGQPGQPQPDLVLPEWGLAIEVGSRVPDGVQELEDAIREAAEANAEPEQIEIVFDEWPLAVRERVRLKIMEQFKRGEDVDEVVRPARDGHPAIHVRITRGPSSGAAAVNTSVTSSRLTSHQQDVVAEIRAKVIEEPRKIAQATSMPTILVIDVTRCGLAWIRPATTWQRVIQDLLVAQDPYVAVAVATDLDHASVRFAWAVNKHGDPELVGRTQRLFECLRRR